MWTLRSTPAEDRFAGSRYSNRKSADKRSPVGWPISQSLICRPRCGAASKVPPAQFAVTLRLLLIGRADSNNFLLDGVYNVDPKLNTFTASAPPVDAIREFEIATSTYDAAFGRNPAPGKCRA